MVYWACWRVKRVVTTRADDVFWGASRPFYARWPAELRLQPVELDGRVFQTAAAAAIETRTVLAHTRLRVTADGVDLRAYSVRPVQ